MWVVAGVAAGLLLAAGAAAWACAPASPSLGLSAPLLTSGEILGLTGTNWVPGVPVDIHWNAGDGPTLATPMAAPDGSFSASVVVPDVSSPGDYLIAAAQGGTHIAAALHVLPNPTHYPVAGPAMVPSPASSGGPPLQASNATVTGSAAPVALAPPASPAPVADQPAGAPVASGDGSGAPSLTPAVAAPSGTPALVTPVAGVGAPAPDLPQVAGDPAVAPAVPGAGPGSFALTNGNRAAALPAARPSARSGGGVPTWVWGVALLAGLGAAAGGISFLRSKR